MTAVIVRVDTTDTDVADFTKNPVYILSWINSERRLVFIYCNDHTIFSSMDSFLQRKSPTNNAIIIQFVALRLPVRVEDMQRKNNSTLAKKFKIRGYANDIPG